MASLGDSRLVLGKKVGNTGEVAAIQLSTEHNANFEEIRHELKEFHPNDPQIVVLKHGVWRVKGIIQVIINTIFNIDRSAHKCNLNPCSKSCHG